MKESIKVYFKDLKGLFDKVIVSNKDGKIYEFSEAIETTARMIIKQAKAGGKLIFIGNGASAAISSHVVCDFWKNARVKAIAFNDISGLTAVSNDFGYKHVFEKPIEMFSERGDILIAISSSGQSGNILLGVEAAKKNGCRLVTLSGFEKDNPLRKLGEINFYVPATSYGHVEVLHLSICHCLVDTIIGR